MTSRRTAGGGSYSVVVRRRYHHAYDGSPLPIEPFRRTVDGVAQPALYQSFMYLFAGGMVPFGTSAFERCTLATATGSSSSSMARSCRCSTARIATGLSGLVLMPPSAWDHNAYAVCHSIVAQAD